MKNLLLIIFIFSFFISSCEKKHIHEEENVWYTCSMDPQVMEKKPGFCPICKMELTKTVIDLTADRELIQLSETQIELGNIKTGTAERAAISESNSSRGIVRVNEGNEFKISSWTGGRIEKLAIKETGVKIKKGQFLYSLYSESLLQTVENYLMLLEKEKALGQTGNIDYSTLINAAKEKLYSQGLQPSQLKYLKRGIKEVPFYSDYNGYLISMSVSEGDYVNEGTEIAAISDLSSVWVEMELYPGQESFVQKGQKVSVKVDGYDNYFSGTVIDILPQYKENTKILTGRILLVKEKNELVIPGLRATIAFSGNQNNKLIVPKSAVMEDAAGKIIWVKTSENSFKHKMVKTGKETMENIEILSGIEEGEEIVVSGVYLLHSEYKLRNTSSANIHQH